jgi:hypothetical protein
VGGDVVEQAPSASINMPAVAMRALLFMQHL